MTYPTKNILSSPSNFSSITLTSDSFYKKLMKEEDNEKKSCNLVEFFKVIIERLVSSFKRCFSEDNNDDSLLQTTNITHIKNGSQQLNLAIACMPQSQPQSPKTPKRSQLDGTYIMSLWKNQQSLF